MWGEANIMGLHVRSRCWGIELLKGRSRARRRRGETTEGNLDAHPRPAHVPTLFSPAGRSSPLGRGRSLLLAPSLTLAQFSQTLPHADGHLRAQAPHEYAAGQSHRVG